MVLQKTGQSCIKTKMIIKGLHKTVETELGENIVESEIQLLDLT